MLLALETHAAARIVHACYMRLGACAGGLAVVDDVFVLHAHTAN